MPYDGLVKYIRIKVITRITNTGPVRLEVIATIHNLMSSFDKRAVLDISKAFDTVSHDSKDAHSGIDKNIWQWISAFLKGGKQIVIVDGKSSLFADVDSGVPQGTMLGHFFLYINDIFNR